MVHVLDMTTGLVHRNMDCLRVLTIEHELRTTEHEHSGTKSPSESCCFGTLLFSLM